jgi:phosphoribosyl-ATP pyrophosphohydrolase/phosphoribosyl-AMP cyclohydrolase
MRDRSAPLTEADFEALDWEKMDGLLPAVVQDAATLQLLMLGYMNRDALAATVESGFATFFSRSKGRLWQKGETSGHRLAIKGVFADCDDDALLVLAEPAGPTCHLGTTSCFGEANAPGIGWLEALARIVHQRAGSRRRLARKAWSWRWRV